MSTIDELSLQGRNAAAMALQFGLIHAGRPHARTERGRTWNDSHTISTNKSPAARELLLHTLTSTTHCGVRDLSAALLQQLDPPTKHVDCGFRLRS